MTASTDFTTICTILKGSAPTNAQLAKVANMYKNYLTSDTPTSEQRAQAALTGMREKIRSELRALAENAVYSDAMRQAHLPANQQALIASVAAEAAAAGAAAEADF